MKLKGTTRIELTDVNTGEVKVIEESNFVTNALKNFCQPILRNHDLMQTSYFKREGVLNIETMMRGLLLFDKTFDENADIFFPPQDFEQIGHAGAITYTGSDLSLGSYNNNQSIVNTTTDERTYVWDFTAEQANGIIRSICLTTQEGGIIGHGTKTLQEMETTSPRHFSNFVRSKFYNYNKDYVYPYNRVPVYLSLRNDYLLLCDLQRYSQGYLSFYKVSLDSNNFDLFKKHQNVNGIESSIRCVSYIGEGFTSVEHIEVDVSSVTGTGTYFGIAQDGKYLYFTDRKELNETSSANAWAPGATIKLLKVNLETLEYEEMSVTNTTGIALAIRGTFSTQGIYANMFGVASGYLYARSWVQYSGENVAQLFAINLANNTVVRQVEDANGSKDIVGVPGNIDAPSFIMSMFGKPFFSQKAGMIYGNASSQNLSPMCCVSNADFKKRYLISPFSTIGSEDSSFTQTSGRIFPVDNELYYAADTRKGTGTYISNSYIVCGMPNALMTINNLASPVEKLPSQTMRITYKLTKE